MVCMCCVAFPFLVIFGIFQLFKDYIISFLSIESLLKQGEIQDKKTVGQVTTKKEEKSKKETYKNK